MLYASLRDGDRGDTAVVTLFSAREASAVAHRLQGMVVRPRLPGVVSVGADAAHQLACTCVPRPLRPQGAKLVAAGPAVDVPLTAHPCALPRPPLQLPHSSHRLFIRPFHDHVIKLCLFQPAEAAHALKRLKAAAAKWEKTRRRRLKAQKSGYPTPKRKAAVKKYPVP